MAFDANLVLKGHYSGALVDTDESDAAAVAIAANSDGNCVVEIKETGAKGLAAVVILTEEADSAAYSDETTIEIQDSDELDRGWEAVAKSGILRSHLVLLKDCIATTGFVALDATTPRVLTATTEGSTGLIVAFDEALKTVDGIGDILVEMQDDADVYATAGVVITATSGTGVGTQGLAGTKVGVQHQPGVHVIRFASDKRYVRAVVTAADCIGKVWILLTDIAFKTI